MGVGWDGGEGVTEGERDERKKGEKERERGAVVSNFLRGHGPLSCPPKSHRYIQVCESVSVCVFVCLCVFEVNTVCVPGHFSEEWR